MLTISKEQVLAILPFELLHVHWRGTCINIGSVRDQIFKKFVKLVNIQKFLSHKNKHNLIELIIILCISDLKTKTIFTQTTSADQPFLKEFCLLILAPWLTKAFLLGLMFRR